MDALSFEARDKDEFFNNLMVDYLQDVWNYIFSLTRSVDLTNDLTQECFIRAYVHMSSLRDSSFVKTWLLKIGRNLVHDHRRSAFVRRVTLSNQLPNVQSNSAEQEALQRIVSEEVWVLVLSLPRKLREVLVLYAHNQLSMTEIANLLGISERGVRSRLHRARSSMKALLKEDGYHE